MAPIEVKLATVETEPLLLNEDKNFLRHSVLGVECFLPILVTFSNSTRFFVLTNQQTDSKIKDRLVWSRQKIPWLMKSKIINMSMFLCPFYFFVYC